MYRESEHVPVDQFDFPTEPAAQHQPALDNQPGPSPPLLVLPSISLPPNPPYAIVGQQGVYVIEDVLDHSVLLRRTGGFQKFLIKSRAALIAHGLLKRNSGSSSGSFGKISESFIPL